MPECPHWGDCFEFVIWGDIANDSGVYVVLTPPNLPSAIAGGSYNSYLAILQATL